jgi:hypothetical protein
LETGFVSLFNSKERPPGSKAEALVGPQADMSADESAIQRHPNPTIQTVKTAPHALV